ncbi:MAG: antibiotic biosynthesis monooxygenase [Citrobacter freundii]|nr:MAG: antibiotic biosynthesis monooxygenase [Citrobacter freundii]
MSSQPIYVFAKWQVKKDQVNTVLTILKDVTKKTREEKGNIFYKVHQSTADENTIVLYESYTDAQAMEEHRSSDHFQTMVIGKIVPLLDNREVTVMSALDLGE